MRNIGWEWELPVLLAEEDVMFDDEKREVQRLVNETGAVCERRNLEVFVAKSRVSRV